MPNIVYDVKLDFKDVLLRPKRSTLRSRADVSLLFSSEATIWTMLVCTSSYTLMGAGLLYPIIKSNKVFLSEAWDFNNKRTDWNVVFSSNRNLTLILKWLYSHITENNFLFRLICTAKSPSATLVPRTGVYLWSPPTWILLALLKWLKL